MCLLSSRDLPTAHVLTKQEADSAGRRLKLKPFSLHTQTDDNKSLAKKTTMPEMYLFVTCLVDVCWHRYLPAFNFREQRQITMGRN